MAGNDGENKDRNIINKVVGKEGEPGVEENDDQKGHQEKFFHLGKAIVFVGSADGVIADERNGKCRPEGEL